MASSIGSLTGAFGNVITFDWYPEPIVVANEISGYARAFENMTAPLESAQELVSADIASRFESKTDPDGAPWQEWSESYEASGRGNELMVLSGALAGAAESDSNFEMRISPAGGELIYTGAAIPEYGFWHQVGLEGRLNRYGAPSPLPQRAFVGVDAETEMQIVAAFDAWVSAVIGSGGIVGKRYPVSVFKHAGGWEQYRVGGWWGPKV